MGASNFIPLLHQLINVNANISQLNIELQEKNTMLHQLGDGLVNYGYAADTPGILQQISDELTTLIDEGPVSGAEHDQAMLTFREVAGSTVIESDDPEIETVWTQLNDIQYQAKQIKEALHLMNEQLPVHDTLAQRLGRVPTADEWSIISAHRYDRDQLGLLAVFGINMMSNLILTIDRGLIIFMSIMDPRIRVQSKTDAVPFALLPVRLETRFMIIKHVRNNKIFTSVNDAFRSDNDVTLALDLDREEAVSQTWIDPRGDAPAVLQPVAAPQVVPDKHELWIRIYPDDIAVHAHENMLSQDELDAAQIYWDEMWHAYNNANRQLGAWRALAGAFGPERAAWVARQTVPVNGNSQPGSEVNEGVVLMPPPQLPPTTVKPLSWAGQAHSNVMPEHFVARLYDANGGYREIQGAKVPSPLPFGFDPSGGHDNYLTQSAAGLNLPPELRWLTDFEEAERIGMGIRVSLSGNEITAGFKRLLVLGLKLEPSNTANVKLLEELFDNHHYKTGLALVPQGTATNNTTGEKSGYASYDPGKELSFATERQSDLFSVTPQHYHKPDGQRLAEALGISPSVFYHVANSNRYDGKESMAMSRALWSGTLGYYMKHLLFPEASAADISNTRAFFTDYVHGRGLVPAFRVKNQPYGVLPTTVYSRWDYSNPNLFEAKMNRKVLQPLNAIFEDLSLGVEHINGPTATANTTLTNILGLQPSSVGFHQRVAAGAFLMWNLHTFVGSAGLPTTGLSSTFYDIAEVQNLDTLYRTTLNFSYLNIPRILSMNFMKDSHNLNGPVIDLPALSEKDLIRGIGNTNKNYLEWLHLSSLKAIREENFTNIGAAANQPPPRALLYLLLRHALFLEHLDTSHCLLTTNNIVTKDVWMNHELIDLQRGPGDTPVVSQEQRDMLYTLVKAERRQDAEEIVQASMQNLANDPFYQASGMTPKQYEIYLRDQAAPQIEQDAQKEYGTRLERYHVEQSQWFYLTSAFPQLTGTLSMEDYLYTADLAGPCVAQLNEVRDALSLLKTLPTARLERCFAEHLDTCAYRFDSWMTGMVTKRLDEQRAATPNGIYIGAYSMLEELKPGPFPGIHVEMVSDGLDEATWDRTAARLGARRELLITAPGDLPTSGDGIYDEPINVQLYQPATFTYIGDDPKTELVEDRRTGRIFAPPRENPNNGGFILAPSLTHAVTAAILRAGYIAHGATSSPTDAMAVNLSSGRVRKALYFIEGIRNGQTLSSLLGYQFERGLHDEYSGVNSPPPLDSYLYSIRQEYPLVAGSVTDTGIGNSNNDAQARQVTDGLKLIEAFRKTSPTWYANISPAIPQGDRAIIEKHIGLMIDSMDAVGDLLLAESVYQVTRGNFNRSGAVVNALSRGQVIPDPEILTTPRQNHVSTHRCAIQMSPANAPANTWAGTGTRALTEPALNKWLASQLPAPANIKIRTTYPNGSLNVSIANLGLQPIDLVAMFGAPGSDILQGDSELSRRVAYYVSQNAGSDKTVTIDYRSTASMSPGDRTIFELTPVLSSLVQLIGKGRALTAEDFLRPNETNGVVGIVAGGAVSTALAARISSAISSTTAPLGLAGVNNLFTALTNNNTIIQTAKNLSYTNGIPAGALTALNNLRSALMSASLFGIVHAVPETVFSDSEATRNSLVDQATRTASEIARRLAKASARYATYASLATETLRVRELAGIAQDIYGRDFKVLPEFALYNTGAWVAGSVGMPSLMTEAGPFGIDEWMQGIARVRPQMSNYRKLMVMAESVTESVTSSGFTVQRVLQLPHDGSGDARWIGMELPANYEVPDDALSIVLESDVTGTADPVCGLLVDEWTEHIPVKDMTTGIAMNYDQPNNEAPQSILLAVTPQVKGYWLWNDLMDTLNETIGMAMKRAVEPSMIQSSSQKLSQTLPGIAFPMTGGTDVSPSLDLDRNRVNVTNGHSAPIGTAFTVIPSNAKNLNPSNNPGN
jgi:hypothetical protein